RYEYTEFNWITRSINRNMKDTSKGSLENNSTQKVTMADEQGNIASVKTGRAPSLGRGLSELVGGSLFGVIWINTTAESGPQYWSLIGYFIIASSVITGIYHMYNAFAKNRFSAQDIVSPDKEPDPLNRVLGHDVRQDHSYCTNCGEKTNDDNKFCSNCGTKVV
ncbi:hypothetical protein VIOR3934_17407, partial [Vibrio orientalis CIP 102891 = ATCC 33934]